MRSITGHRDFGLGAANTALVRACVNIHPDVLMLGHAQYITRTTSRRDPQSSAGDPDCPMVWGCDLGREEQPAPLFDRMSTFDAMFISTGGDVLEQFSAPGRVVCFMPNPIGHSIECHKAFECDEPEYDVIFFGRDEPERNAILKRVIAALPEIKFGIFGCLGQPCSHGACTRRNCRTIAHGIEPEPQQHDDVVFLQPTGGYGG